MLEIGEFSVPFLSEKDLSHIIRREMDGQPSSPTEATPSDQKTIQTTERAPTQAPVKPPPSSSHFNDPLNSPTANALPSAPSPSPGPASIGVLMDLGASEEQAVQALKAANGNVDVAAGLLFDAM